LQKFTCHYKIRKIKYSFCSQVLTMWNSLHNCLHLHNKELIPKTHNNKDFIVHMLYKDMY